MLQGKYITDLLQVTASLPVLTSSFLNASGCHAGLQGLAQSGLWLGDSLTPTQATAYLMFVGPESCS